MLKYPVPGEPEVLPQLRPEFAVRTGSTTWHRHDKPFLNEEDPAKALAKHIRDEHGGDTTFPVEASMSTRTTRSTC